MTPQKHSTAMFALGSSGLMKGFSLIGFETFPDASVSDLEQLINKLVTYKQRALIIIEQYLYREGKDIVQPVIAEGGGIIIVEIPPITDPNELVSVVSEKVKHRLGVSALRDSA